MPYTITQISQAKRSTERVNIYLNGAFWLGLSKNNLITLKLFNDKVLTDSEKRDIESTAVNSNLIDKALKYSVIRPRSCAEVRDYLVYKKGISLEEAENVITHLQNQGFLSDEKFAQWYVDYKLRMGVNGINKIKMELMQKKVNPNIISDVLEKIYSNDDFKSEQLVKIEEYARKIIETIKSKNAYELKAKLTQRLMARGFKYNEIKEAINIPEFTNIPSIEDRPDELNV